MCYIILLLVMAKKQKYIFWGNNECMLGKNMYIFALKPLQMCDIKEQVNLGKLTDVQIRWNNRYIHFL